MTDYISRDAAINLILEYIEEYAEIDEHGFHGEKWCAMKEAEDCLKSLPAADVREEKRGKWKRVVDFTGVEAFGYKETMLVGYGCNVCGYEVDVSEGDYNYCPNCGSDMRDEQT